MQTDLVQNVAAVVGSCSKKAQNIQEGSRCKGIQGGTSKDEIKCVCLNARSIINKKNELNIMIICITELRYSRPPLKTCHLYCAS